MGSEFTFFQTLEDHVTLPVLFIPETHLSSLQRVVSSPPTAFMTFGRVAPRQSVDSSPSSLHPHFTPRRHERGRVGKKGGVSKKKEKKRWESM